MARSVDQTQLEQPYTFFLFKALAHIYEAWNELNVVYALSQTCKLVVFLPNDVKESLWPDKEAIQKDLGIAHRANSTSWFQTRIERNKQVRGVAYHYLEPFLDKMVRLLDEKGWLERGAMRPRYPGTKKLSVDVIDAK